jgi:hypothetical protein
MHPQVPDPRLTAAVDELERHVAQAGWAQPTRLFALVSSDDIIADEPRLAADLGLVPGTLTSVEQDGFVRAAPLDELLAGIQWPDAVAGVAVAVERLVLPPSAEAQLPDGSPEDVATAAAAHPERTDVRIVAAVTRDDDEDAVLRLQDRPEHLIRAGDGQRLVPQLFDALRATLD